MSRSFFVLLIIGSGPSVVGKRLGAWIDQQTVVRLKAVPVPNVEDWGSRCDFRCGSSVSYRRSEPYWLHASHPLENFEQPGVRRADRDRWLAYFGQFNPSYKSSTGLKALFCAVEFGYLSIGLAGFDNLLYPEEKGWGKWTSERHKHLWVHDSRAEHAAAFGLGVTLIDVTREHG